VDRTRAAGIGQATIAVASIIGPPLAAPLLFTIGVQWALAVNAASYLFSYFAIRSVRLSGSDGLAAGEPAKAGLAGVRAEFSAGVRVFFGSRFLRTLLGIAVIAQCGTGALNTLGIFFVTSDLHAPARLYGFMATAFGIGALIGSLWAGRVARWFGPRTMTALGLAVAGALVLAYARQSYFAAAVVLLGLVAVPVAMLNTALTPLLLKATPPEYLGRVIAVFNPLNQLASMLSVIVAGWLASNVLRTFSATLLGMRFGPIDTIFTAAGVLLLLSGGYAYLALPREKLAGEAAVEPASVPTSG
jgi:MFS family permease